MKRFQVITLLALALVASVAYAIDPVTTAAVLPGLADPTTLGLTALAIGATNFVQEGETLTLAAPYDVASGAGMKVGNLFGVALGAGDYSDGDDVETAMCGVWDLHAITLDTYAVGAKVYWDDSGKTCDATSTGNTFIGIAVKAKINTETTVRVLLLPGIGA